MKRFGWVRFDPIYDREGFHEQLKALLGSRRSRFKWMWAIDARHWFVDVSVYDEDAMMICKLRSPAYFGVEQ